MEPALGYFISAIISMVLNKSTNAILKYLKDIRQGSETLKKLETTILGATEQLEKVDTFLLQGNAHIVLQDRIDNLALLCYDAEDMIDDIQLMIMKKVKWRWVKKHGVKTLQKKLEDIQTQLKLLVGLMPQQKHEMKMHSELVVKEEGKLIGRDIDVKEIVENLISPNDKNGVCIVGMTLLGKTTLAKAILDNTKISEKFCVLFLPVPDGMFNSPDTISRLKKFEQEASFETKALLICFDNLLKVKLLEWDAFLTYIRKPNLYYKHVKFLITTPNPQVSENTRTITHRLNLFTEEHCKELIIEKAMFHKSTLTGWSHFSSISSALAKKCGGLPGVATLLGVCLGTCDKENWTAKFNGDLWDMLEFKEEIFPNLISSYSNMKHHHKRCFAYFALFPQEYGYNVEDLSQLWSAEGFTQHLEGETCFIDLVGRSILQQSDLLTSFGTLTYSLHKFHHICSKLVASSIFLRLQSLECASNSVNNIRHLSLSGDIIDLELVSGFLKGVKGLRTFLTLFNQTSFGDVKIPPNLLKQLRYLRVLTLSGINVTHLPGSIENLEHLRYLDISNTRIKSLPEKLCELKMLQFLKIRGTKLSCFPRDLHKLTNLQYVDWQISDIRQMRLPSNIGSLSRLETLPLFHVGDEEGYYIQQLGNLSELRGSICITHLENVDDKTMAEAAHLCKKSFLKKIELEWINSPCSVVANEVLTSLKPHINLKELKITNYNSDLFPEWICHSSRMIENIHLNNCRSCNILPALGDLPDLKFLILQEFPNTISMDNLFRMSMETSGVGQFKSLIELTLIGFTMLQEWTTLKREDLPSLRIFRVANCPKLIKLPPLKHLSLLKNLQIENCPVLTSLPSLPDSLQSLIIRQSQLLKDRCHSGAEDWEKVDRIPEVKIDDEEVRTSGASNTTSIVEYMGFNFFEDKITTILSNRTGENEN